MVMDVKTCGKSGSSVLGAQILTPIGPLTLSSCAGGFHSISFDKSPADNNNIDKLAVPRGELLKCKYSFPEAPEDLGSPFLAAKKNLDQQAKWVQNYFRCPQKDAGVTEELMFSQFCLDHGTPFEISVWKTLFDNVKLGQTTSYAKLAESINNPKAARAVGTALKKNPIVLMIPCHRVIKSDGSLGSFAGGRWNECKEFLCHHEKLRVPDEDVRFSR